MKGYLVVPLWSLSAWNSPISSCKCIYRVVVVVRPFCFSLLQDSTNGIFGLPAVIHAIDRDRSHMSSCLPRPSTGRRTHSSDYLHGNATRQPSVSASVRNASRRLSESRAGVCPMAGRGAGAFGSIHQFVLVGVMGYFRVVLHLRLQQDLGPITADR